MEVYQFIATRRGTNENIVLCEWDNLVFFETIMKYFDKSDNISRFAIVKDNKIIKEKVLEFKEGSGLCLRK